MRAFLVKRILKRNFDHLCNKIPILQPKSILPFAGSYIIGGKNYYKNEYLGTTTWDECAEYLKDNMMFDSKVFCLRENQTYDIKNQKQLEKYEKLDVTEMKKYIQSLKGKKYFKFFVKLRILFQFMCFVSHFIINKIYRSQVMS